MKSLYDTKRIQLPDVDRRIASIAAGQHGVFTRAQALAAGATPGVIRVRLEKGRWTLRYPRIYRLSGAPPTRRQEAAAVCLFLSAVLSHRAAADLTGMLPSRRFRMEVTMPRNRNRARLPNVVVHRISEPIPPEDLTTIDGIPVTRPARTLLDLASAEPAEVVERCLDDCLRRRSVSLAFLDRWLDDPRRRRHRGASVLRRLVDARATAGVTESPLESEVLALMRDAGLPLPMLQYVVADADGRFVARVDFAYPAERVAIEADGFRFHDRRDGFDRERARGNDLEALGWRVLRLTSAHVRDREAVARWIRAALGATGGTGFAGTRGTRAHPAPGRRGSR